MFKYFNKHIFILFVMKKCQKIENCPAQLKRAELVEVTGACNIPGLTNSYKSPYRNTPRK